MFFLRKILRVLFSCHLCFEILSFVLLPTYFPFHGVHVSVKKTEKKRKRKVKEKVLQIHMF